MKRKLKSKLQIISFIVFLIIIFGIGVYYFVNNLMFPDLNWVLESSTCTTGLKNPNDICEYILKLDVPNRANSTNFYISISQSAQDDGSFQNRNVVYIYNSNNNIYEEINNKLIDISTSDSSDFNYRTAITGETIDSCLNDDNKCKNSWNIWVACDNNTGLPYNLMGPDATYYPNPSEPYNYHCINTPNCYNKEDSNSYRTTKICSQGINKFNDSYFFNDNNIMRFKLIKTRNSGTGITSPETHTDTNLININFDITPELIINNQTNQSTTNQTTTNQTTSNNQNTTTTNQITCWKLRGFAQQAFSGEDSPCYNKTFITNCSSEWYLNEQSCVDSLTYKEKGLIQRIWEKYGLYATIISVILTIIVTSISLYFMFRKKK